VDIVFQWSRIGEAAQDGSALRMLLIAYLDKEAAVPIDTVVEINAALVFPAWVRKVTSANKCNNCRRGERWWKVSSVIGAS
jgi:hypothetical protein